MMAALAVEVAAGPAGMRVLPDRLYGTDANERRRQLPHGRRHPAKMNLELLGDLIRRYTLPGQTWLDPFFGVGSTGTAVLTGRSVIGVELEAHHAADARLNVAHLAQWARGGATATVLQGDSRKLGELLETAGVGTLTSPPFGGSEAVDNRGVRGVNMLHRGGNAERRGYEHPDNIANLPVGSLASPPYADSVNSGGHGIDWKKMGPATGNRRRGEGTAHAATLRAQLNYGAPAGAVMSPPYGDVAKRDRSKEPYASKDPERAAEYGQDSPSRNIDGYGKDGAQIGNLPMVERYYGRPEGMPETYLGAVREVYDAVYDVTPPGGVLVLVTGNYVREGKVVDLAAHTISVCASLAWTPVERWRAKKKQVSFWRRLHARKGLPLIDYEDVLVFCKGAAPGWDFAELPIAPAAVSSQAEMSL